MFGLPIGSYREAPRPSPCTLSLWERRQVWGLLSPGSARGRPDGTILGLPWEQSPQQLQAGSRETQLGSEDPMGHPGPVRTCKHPPWGGGAVSQDHPLSKVGTQAPGGGTCWKSHVCHNGGELWLNEDTEDTGVPSSHLGAPRGPASSPAHGLLSPLALGMWMKECQRPRRHPRWGQDHRSLR